MSYRSSFAWRASLTRIPPPICTSAPGSQTALIWRATDVADNKTNTLSEFSDNPWIRWRRRLFATVAMLQMRHRESKFLNPRTDSCASQTTAQYQKNFINNLRLLLRRSVFQSLANAMRLSNSRRVIFHDCFCRVTPVADSRRPRSKFHLRCVRGRHFACARFVPARVHPVKLRDMRVLYVACDVEWDQTMRHKNKKPGVSRAS